MVYLFSELNASAPPGTREDLQRAFDTLYANLNSTFDYQAFDRTVALFQEGVKRYQGTDAYTAYAQLPTRPHCDLGVAPAPAPPHVGGFAAFPGGITQKAFGSDFAKSVEALSKQAEGPEAARLVSAAALRTQNLNLGMGMIQSMLAAMVHTVPPLIPPPVWNNQPLPCAPMVTGHNCFGAVLYPITMADFVLADVTDSMLDGVIAGFPNTYASKVGKTSDEMYKACFASYMSMHCSSIFPRCSLPQSREEAMPIGGRVPMCLHLCVVPLVMCPGFWVDDIMGTCSMVSVPPLCTQAFFVNLWRLPPQYTDFDEANPFPKDCPPADPSDAAEDPSLYDVPNESSPILKEVHAVKGESPGNIV